ncbi:sigma factor sigB regulation protein rsbQ [Hymenobacter lapidarius]|uniref:Sigma factor sigB regulation protein rsbQ n=1 Tax=Hymenobacter lapidarius TaxID=1908237 RepID=A0A1G1T9B4_9BACT|nr:alpha/beta hydrolase [Hymenobacter lapidarius]OGX87451.1 sigma factor sigB regulation protein rsbQ [Hymenobacter lapidarius]
MSITTPSALKRNNVVISGASGPNTQAIVFLHGLGGDQSMWRLLVPAFEEQYQVVVLDLIGAGESDLTAYSRAAHGTLDGHATDLLNVMSELALHDAVFVGHSVGAMIGVLAAVREPQRFAKMVLVSPSARFINERGYAGGFEQKDINELLAAMDGNYNGWSQAFAPVMMGPDEHPELVMELTNSFVRTNPEIARHFARVTFFSDSRAELPFLTIPTLIVQSANDVIAPLAVGHYINEQLADSRMVVVETGGHCPHLSAPQKTLSAMDKFLHHETAL